MSKIKKGGMTGADLNPKNRGNKGGLTGSKHFEPISVDSVLKDIDNPSNQTNSTQTNSTQTANKPNQSNGTDIRSTRKKERENKNHSIRQEKSTLTTDSHAKVLEGAKEIGQSYGVQLTDIKAHMSVSNDTVDESLGEGISKKEANARLLKIERQNNLIEVRNARIKQKRKIATNYGEELGLLGDTVGNATKAVNVAKKFVEYQTEVTDFHTAQSKLEEHEELYLQQAIKTQGVKNLTAGIEEEWELKFVQQESRNDALFLAIESSDKRNEQTRLEMEAFLLSD
ncbi:MAG: hypothetical protein KME38_29400 [Spirirestis rafaelensis WJT71-NPBG6]|jgi:hypothetical protein|nr:hypothetical protein [Spirirestis rafaelensis WJT71-NPBG6]